MQVEAYFASVENTYFVSFTNYNPMLPFNSYSIDELILFSAKILDNSVMLHVEV